MQIFEKIKVFCFYIKNDSNGGEKFEEAVGVFTCFGDKMVGSSYSNISSDLRQNAAYRDGGIHICFQKDVGSDGSGGGFAVGAGDGDGGGIIFHHLTNHGSTLHHRNPQFFCADIFWIVLGNCRRIHNKIYI